MVSKNRTTIVIAHRLSTIRKADKIVVIRDGKNMEEGTHESLLSIRDGIYAGLVNAQQLEGETESSIVKTDEVAPLEELERKSTSTSLKSAVTTAESYRTKGFFASVGLLLYEQRAHWRLYLAIMIAAIAAGSKWRWAFHISGEANMLE